MRVLLDIAYLILAIAYIPILIFQRVFRGKIRTGWGERFGHVPVRVGDKPCIWIHAVSLGEANAAVSLVAEFRRRLPDHDIVVSTTTDTGRAAAIKHFGDASVFRYPLDFSWMVRRALDRIRPRMVILMELEVWPNFIDIATARGIPVGIANGRVTAEKSMRRFQLPILASLARRMFGKLSFIAAQDDTYAKRFVELGAPASRVQMVGNLKYDTALIADCVDGDAALGTAMGIDSARPLIVAGSTGPDEEPILINTYDEILKTTGDVQLAIIPRKPERFDEVAAMIEARGFNCLRRSHLPDGTTPPAASGRAVLLGDTMGELRKFYSLATVVFVGRTLVPLGGSDLMEVAGLAKPMCYGPHVENFADADAQLRTAEGAYRVTDAAALLPALRGLLKDEAWRQKMGANAREVVRRNQGATSRTVDFIMERMAART